MARKESDLRDDVMEILKAIPESIVVKIAGNAFQKSGLPDVFFTCWSINGRAVWLELKTPGEKPRKLQQHKMDELSRAGAFTCAITSVYELDQVLEHLGVVRRTL